MRCVNIDWLEVYALEDNLRYPCNADYFRAQGYFVSEREFGTRQYKEMFTLQDVYGYNLVEVRRNPYSGDSEFSGLNERSCHIRLVNRYCYFDNAVRIMAEFLLRHDYELQRIFRIDIAYDFCKFDFGDDPQKFLKRYIEKKYSKVNQCKVRVFGDDGWNAFDWESISWGHASSMVGTKMYNKTKELKATGNAKPWIVQAWFESGLINDPLNLPDVWRIEFSLHSSARNWLVIENNDGKHEKKEAIPHTLELFDGRDRLWQRFQDLAHHYFQFRYVEYKSQANSDGTRDLLRKDLCHQKKLFRWDTDRTFYKLDNVSRESKPKQDSEILRRRLQEYHDTHIDKDIRNACNAILDNLDREALARVTAHGYASEIDAIRLAIATRTGWDYKRVVEVAEEIHKLIIEKEIW